MKLCLTFLRRDRIAFDFDSGLQQRLYRSKFPDMMRMWTLIKNRNLLLALAIVMGLVSPGAAPATKQAVLPVLAVIMTLSTVSIRGSWRTTIRENQNAAVYGVFANYILLGGLILGLGTWLIRDPDFGSGMVVMAAIPPAVAIIPFSFALDGDVAFSLVGVTAGYLAGLVLAPLVFLVFLGPGIIGPRDLLIVAVELIFIPVLAGRLMTRFGWDRTIEPFRGGLTNLGFMVIVYSVVGANSDVLIHRFTDVVPVLLAAILTSVVWGEIVRMIGTRMGFDRRRLVSLVLLATMKNTGLAAGLAVAFLNDRAALPATVFTVVMILYFLLLGVRRT
jgi:BASS family bile acid:Na+ symporter